MATRKRTAPQDLEDDPELEEEGEIDELAQVLGELDSAGTGTVKIERLREGKRPEFVGELSPSGFSLGQLQDRFGGGEYALTVLDGSRRYVKRATVAIASLPKPVPLPGAAAEPTVLEKLTATIAAQLQQQGKMMELLVMQQRLAPTVTPAAADPQVLRQQLLEEMKMMKEVMGSGQSMSPDKVMELVMKGMELAKETGGGGGDNWTGVAEKAIDVLGEPLAQLMSISAATPATPAAPTAATVQRQPAITARPTMNPMVKQYVSFLVGKAAKGADPDLYADLVLDNVPEALVRQFMSDPDPVARLAVFDARVAQHAEWFRDLGQACMEALNADAPGSGSGPSPADGDAGGDT